LKAPAAMFEIMNVIASNKTTLAYY